MRRGSSPRSLLILPKTEGRTEHIYQLYDMKTEDRTRLVIPLFPLILPKNADRTRLVINNILTKTEV